MVFQEIPDEVTLSINISNCPCHCPGCHSSYLAQDIGEPLTTERIDTFVNEYGADITCISFMGGDAEPASVNILARHLHNKHPEIKVAWYSGRANIPSEVNKNDFDYIKTGPYIEHLGSLKDRTTNQRLYKRDENNKFQDITERFWKK